jgi:dTDP-4-amino-4,6-dideoxygalactose transaminase
MNIFDINRALEEKICEFTGAPYCVTTTSCTTALLIAVKWHVKRNREAWMEADRLAYYEPIKVSIPNRTYVGVPQSIINAGARVEFRDEDWYGSYYLNPLPVLDCARWFESNMYEEPGEFLCCSFQATKLLADSQGGCILHDDPEFDEWARRYRFDGRTEGVPASEDNIREVGIHAYLSPDVAARLLWRFPAIGYGGVLPNDDYPDLSVMEAFQ